MKTGIASRHMPLSGGELTLYDHWLAAGSADHYLHTLQHTLRWEQSIIQMFGRPVSIPRLNAWYADPGCDYRYSGYQLPLHAWTRELRELRARVEETAGQRFNAVLANCYRDGRDSVAWHSDDEPELGNNPVIASLSLGATRRFCLRHRQLPQRLSLELSHGSLLVMTGATQHNWQHCLPKTQKPTPLRINLTFRNICILSN